MTGRELARKLTFADVVRFGATLLLIEGDTDAMTRRVIERLGSDEKVSDSEDVAAALLDAAQPVGV